MPKSVNKKDNQTRSMQLEIQSNEETPDIYDISFSSEIPYKRWFGPEILDHTPGSFELERLNEAGALLYNHGYDANYSMTPIGSISDIRLDNGKLRAKIKFDEDEKSQIIKKKVDSKSIKGISVGYSVSNWEEVETGSLSTCGRFTGPCSIARKWTPYEISVVPVPADIAVGFGKSLETESETDADDFINEKNKILKNLEFQEIRRKLVSY